ncbi:unnamed protein product [Discosporangium mesarthrocarpum]
MASLARAGPGVGRGPRGKGPESSGNAANPEHHTPHEGILTKILPNHGKAITVNEQPIRVAGKAAPGPGTARGMAVPLALINLDRSDQGATRPAPEHEGGGPEHNATGLELAQLIMAKSFQEHGNYEESSRHGSGHGVDYSGRSSRCSRETAGKDDLTASVRSVLQVEEKLREQEAPVKITQALHPIYFLFVAPPSAAALAWRGIVDNEFDSLSKGLYFISLFLYLFFVFGHTGFLYASGFSVAWWAYAFPSAAFASSTLFYAESLGSEALVMFALFLALLSSVLTGIVLTLTLRMAYDGKLFTKDPVLTVRLDAS